MTIYTAASARLRHLEVDFNTDLPASTYRGTSGQGTSPQGNPPLAPILYLDYDQISTWYAMPEGPDSLEEAIGDYLMVRTGHPASDTTETILAQAMNSLDAEGVVRQRNGSGNCLVVPEYPGISFDSFYAASLSSASGRDGPDLLAGKKVTIGLPTRAFQDFVDAHESWHCLDIRYIRDTGDGLEGAVKQNRTEMFADIGGAMEGIRDGADLTLIDKVAELRASWSLLTGPVHARNEDNK